MRESTLETVLEIDEVGEQRTILATGTLHDFVVCGANAKWIPGKGIIIDGEAARLLGVKAGDQVLAVTR